MAERKDQTSLLSSISAPTLLIFGERDNITNLETARAMSAEIPDSTLIIIEQAGHYSNLEQPEQFNTALGDFLAHLKS